ncbi:MAG TPA: substrate-binding domain-containing protein [Pirellulales bacterium]|jgi:ribose transport system substrate-binding protein|nr:substrate-binding domain-containing protein [Pirellulales bacterium]
MLGLVRAYWIGFVAAFVLTAGCDSQPAAHGKRIVILTNTNSPYWDTGREGLKAAAKELKLEERGLSAVMIVNDGTPHGQINQLRQFASQSDIVAVGISVTDAGNAEIADQMRALRDKGVHVMAIDGDLDRARFSDARYAFIGTDNREAGRELGTAVRELRPKGGEYVTFVGRTGAHNAIERNEGFSEGAGAKFTAVDFMGDETDRSRAKENVRNAITNHPAVNTLVGIWSYNGPAIVSVVRELNRRKDFTIVTFDAEPISIEQMAQGELDCMLVQNPFDICYQGVRAMAALVEKKQDVIKEMFPRLGQPEGDLYITNVKLVVPDHGSPLKADMFSDSTEFLKLDQFRGWLAKYGLKGS